MTRSFYLKLLPFLKTFYLLNDNYAGSSICGAFMENSDRVRKVWSIWEKIPISLSICNSIFPWFCVPICTNIRSNNSIILHVTRNNVEQMFPKGGIEIYRERRKKKKEGGKIDKFFSSLRTSNEILSKKREDRKREQQFQHSMLDRCCCFFFSSSSSSKKNGGRRVFFVSIRGESAEK